MPKRQRLSFEHDNISALTFAKVPTVGAVVRKTSSTNETKTIQAGSAVVKFKDNCISYRQLLDSLFPVVKKLLRGYGVNMHGFTSTGAVATLPNPMGDASMLRADAGHQGWYESIGLPLWHYKLTDLSAKSNCTIPHVMSVADLRTLAYSAQVAATESQPLDPNPAAGSSGNYIGMTVNHKVSGGEALARGLKCQMAYCGGYQRHTFKNVSTVTCTIEVWECCPRNYMVDWTPAATGASGGPELSFRSVGQMLKADNITNSLRVNNTALFNGGSYPYQTTTTSVIDDMTDPNVTIRKDSRIVHTHFKVSKPVIRKLSPGDSFVYTMYFPAFSFSESAFTRELVTTGFYVTEPAMLAADVHSTFTEPTSVPKFTKRLVVRFFGEQGVATGDGVDLDIVQNTPCNLAHTVTEFHKVRHMPEINKDYTIVTDNINYNAEAGMEFINPESDEIQTANVID